ncbi:MAG TPA: DNA replication/repair protein RecF [Anaerolineales bacterium]|nr:DNA replication/repair protein RecF [Anaerolineales bacterium]
MHIQHLSLTNFRNFARLDIDVPQRVLLLVGSNAQGKTSLLEAIYYLASFTSFQTHTDRQLINFVEARNSLAVARLVGDYERNGRKHRLEVRLILEPTGITGQRLRKEALLDGVKRPLHEIVGHFNAVIFVPQMSQIIEGGPHDRRHYLNLALAQAIPAYAGVLNDYNQALGQRNALLKALGENGGDARQLDVWDETLARLGAQILGWRIEAVLQLERPAARIHHELTHGGEVLRMNYQPAYDPLPSPEGQLGMRITTEIDRSGLSAEEIRTGFQARLKQARTEDIGRGITTLGPHRDELRFLANGIDLGDYGSRGQVRTALLAIKLAEVSWMKDRTGEWPVILLDEVMAELDLQRRADLLNYTGEGQQVLFTAADAGMFPQRFVDKSEVWKIENGNISKG